jgi:catechol 2,3-dioxygenase-like lactoylglutathione lyase family enzyme
VARIDHSFTMSEPPAKALARFRDELGPELHRKTGFGLHKEDPNSLLYRDGLLDASSLPEADEDLDRDLGVPGEHEGDAPYDIPPGALTRVGLFGARTRMGPLDSPRRPE